jgi:hypothetical protein
MMNNIKNTMCRLSDLTQEQIDSLSEEMPDNGFLEIVASEYLIGYSPSGNAGTWNEFENAATKIVTYTEMMQLLGKDMNKQTAQEQIAVMQIEMDKLKAIIDKPEAKTGRVLCMDDLERNARYWYVWNSVKSSRMDYDGTDNSRIDAGNAFHDEQSAERHLQYLKLEQELRRAQINDGGRGRYVLVIDGRDSICSIDSLYYEKISFSTQEARDRFRSTHTDEQLTLLIRGV